MSIYCYEEEKKWLFTDEGGRCLFKAVDKARKLLETAGAFKAFKALVDVSYSDSFKAMAILDRLVELGAIREVTSGVKGQDRIFTTP